MTTHIQSFPSSLSLLTDFYELTMAYGYFQENIHEREAVFHLSFRTHPFQGGFAVSAGLELIVDFLKKFRFEKEDISYLKELKSKSGAPLFSSSFLTYLKELTFSCDLDAALEGALVFQGTPVIRVKGPLIQCQILESSLLNLFNFSTLIATKACRIKLAAGLDEVIDFGLRRAQGIDGALTASRSAYIGGCDATSNALAAKVFAIPLRGTHAHSWIMAFDSELASFQAFAKHMPDDTVLLIDTYSTLQGIKNAIEVALSLQKRGHNLLGVRLDSGDLTFLSQKCRALLDEADLKDALIVASNELDEHIITSLKREGAKIDVWGVGTNLVTAKDQPALDGVYKLSAIKDDSGAFIDKLKLSEQMGKISNPGILGVRRFCQDGAYIADVIHDLRDERDEKWVCIDPMDGTRKKVLSEDLESFELLQPIFRKGELVYSLPTLQEIKNVLKNELSMIHPSILRLLNPHTYVVGLEKKLYQKKISLIEKNRKECM